MSEDEKEKYKDHCGFDFGPTGPDLETGDWDPFEKDACSPHDEEMEKLKLKTNTKGSLETFTDFVKNTTKVAAKGLYAVAAYPLYLVIGGLGGLLRFAQIRRNRK